jgi:hypothetical protein
MIPQRMQSTKTTTEMADLEGYNNQGRPRHRPTSARPTTKSDKNEIRDTKTQREGILTSLSLWPLYSLAPERPAHGAAAQHHCPQVCVSVLSGGDGAPGRGQSDDRSSGDISVDTTGGVRIDGGLNPNLTGPPEGA